MRPNQVNQSGNKIGEGDLVAGNKHEENYHYHYAQKTKLSSLFEKLKEEFDGKKTIQEISDNLQRYSDARDTIGLEQKLVNGGRAHILEDAAWLKQEYFKKLTRFQFYETAQEIHAFLLGIVLEKFRNIVYPMIKDGASETDIAKTISEEIIKPIIEKIHNEGCDDVMGLSSTDIEGMIYFLTGKCHIKWAR
ncbi:hypothetical protein F0L74_16595 [Chitinophaga agrisoli]|uniref:ABC-three component systems C-terminal domain-containing protein n=1 Tax=Chitinophaga agrisoli TaxID=2607653 RepID=A0A5B2VRQ6_9BACT|nr:ABC-three component system protein [Chitinophaga agrisoli]KAA2241514.1 hypothetical protein F0L74_16595 [Chitinophaga agrisoli]